MTTKVHILATCLPGARLDATTLVFKTLRTGFPTAAIRVRGNALALREHNEVLTRCLDAKAHYSNQSAIQHDAWIEQLLSSESNPFWICDTDIVFHSSVESFGNHSLLRGRYEPPFVEPWSGTRKTERLHTSLLYFNTPKLKSTVKAWLKKWHPVGFPFQPKCEFVRQCYLPRGPGEPPTFQDTCAGLYLALGGEPFTDSENAAFDHLHCATYVHRMHDTVSGLAEAHGAVYGYPQGAAVMREPQAAFYRAQAYA